MSRQIIPFERLHRFAGIQPNSGFGDHSRLSCSAGDTQLGTGFCWDLQQAFCTDVGHHAASPRKHELAAISSFDQKMIGRRQSQQPPLLSLRWTFVAKRASQIILEKPHRFPGPSRILAASCSWRGWSFRTSQPSGRRSREPCPEFELAPWEQVLSE
jgi:hypothetical protein